MTDADATRGATGRARSRSTPASGLDTVVITGLSGAGRSTAAKCFEDLGYYVVDNLPAELIATLIDLGSRSQGAVTRLAVVHGRAQPGVLLRPARRHPRSRRARHAAPRAVPRGVRRRAGAALRERAPRAPAAGRAAGSSTASRRNASCSRRCATRPTWCSTPATGRCTSCATPSSRRSPATARWPARPTLRATVVSFGYKYGLPVDADLVVDVRFLPNPYWIPELRELTGVDQEVKRLRAQPGGRGRRSSTSTRRS